jgi:CheY-like chemotaxis protein
VHVYQGTSVRVTPHVPFVRSSSAAGGAQQSQAVAQVISLLFVEDHASYRQALRAVMATEHDLCVVAEVETPEEAGASAARSHPVVALVDLDLPYGDGVDAIAEIRASSPATSCVVLSALTDDAELTVHALTGGRLLASAPCWSGAYNWGQGFWVIDAEPPFNPVAVTYSGSDYGHGWISAAHKDRGIGDCWNSNQWVWDGTRFVHAASSSTGLCRQVEAGGAWSLPTLVSQVLGDDDIPGAGSRVLECEAAFPPGLTRDFLTARFGAENVADEDIPLTEGLTEPGTVVFGGSAEERIEILWREPGTPAHPRAIRIRGAQSAWRTEGGMSLGDSLREVERLNDGHFRLAGFEWDHAGVQTSWLGGAFERGPASACGLRIRLEPDEITPGDVEWLMQVLGDEEHASSYPAMQALDPRVRELWLDY